MANQNRTEVRTQNRYELRTHKSVTKEIFKPKSYYLILADNILCAHSKYNVAVTFFDPERTFSEECVVRVQIVDAADKNFYLNERKETVMPNSTKTITVNVDALNTSRLYKVLVESETGFKFKHEEYLHLQKTQSVILIQTNKAIYKPTDNVQFRVLVLDAQLKPNILLRDKLDVFVEDSRKNRIKQWSQVETNKGVFENEFQLSDLPNLGNWKLSAKVADDSSAKKFEVSEYVLPKFEVIIDSPKSFSMKDENLTAIIRAKYMHGKPMKAKALITLSQKYTNHQYAKREMQINGSGLLEFKITDDFCNGSRDEDVYMPFSDTEEMSRNVFVLEAEVTEELTGLSQIVQEKVVIYKKAHRVSLKAENSVYFTPGSTFIVTISVRKHDNAPVIVTDNTKKITVKRINYFEHKPSGSAKVEQFADDYELNANGELEMPLCLKDTVNSFILKVSYMGENYLSHKFCKKDEYGALKVDVLTKNPSIHQHITAQVTSQKALKHYTYHIISERRIIHSESHYLVDSTNTTTSRQFTFLATQDMLNAHIITYFIDGDELVSAKTELRLKNELHNAIDIELSNETSHPGQNVEIKVKTSPGSFVGLLGVDQSVLLLNGSNDLTTEAALNERASFYNKFPLHYNNATAFQLLQVLVFTNIKLRAPDRPRFCGGGPGEKSVSRNIYIRQDFPETWLWQSNANVSFDGVWTFKKKVPDSLTSWIITGFSVDPINGLGITNDSKKLTVFQPFFVSLNLPYSVKRGEVLTVPCFVFNYLERDTQAEVVMDNEYDEFEFIDGSVDEMKPANKNTRKITISIQANCAATANFVIRPVD